ncbi:unnamed protein product [Moneuplotes crassus]|uniref:Uncharacterized protein n=1 Tax=Euplotes crassus TaxID=5936 RepID=A0AAD1Y0P7_EUPCR|nr:unnamed protein product [Moneuplotes crassus]
MGLLSLSVGFLLGTGATLYASDLTYVYIYSHLYAPHMEYLRIRKKFENRAIPPEIHNTYWKNFFLSYALFWYKIPFVLKSQYLDEYVTSDQYLSQEVQNFTGKNINNQQESKDETTRIEFADIENMLDTLKHKDPDKYEEILQKGAGYEDPSETPLEREIRQHQSG